MFDNEPSYLGGLTTQLQDSMQGIQYGRSDVNPNGKYVPNDSASGKVYTEVPKKGKARPLPNKEDLARQQVNAQQANSGDPFAIVQMHVDKLSNESKPIDFFGLTMPGGLIDSTPDLSDWIASLELLESKLQKGLPLSEQLKDPKISVARLALEFIQPGTVKMDAPSQIERTQQLLRHLRNQAKDDPNIILVPKKATFADVVTKSTVWARDNIKHPRTRVGQFSVPQFLIKQDKAGMFSQQSLDALFNALQAQIQAGEDLVVPEESLKVIIPIVAFSKGTYPQNSQQLKQMVSTMSRTQNTQNRVKKTQAPQRRQQNTSQPQLSPLGQQMVQVVTSKTFGKGTVRVGPFVIRPGISITPEQIFQAITAFKAKIVKKDFTALPNPSIIECIALNRKGAQQLRPENPYSMIETINTMRTDYIKWKQANVNTVASNRPNVNVPKNNTPVPNRPYVNAPKNNTSVPNMPMNNNQINSNLPNYVNTNTNANVRPNANVNVMPVNVNLPNNVNLPANNVNLPIPEVKPSLVNRVTEFVSTPTGMATAAGLVLGGLYLLNRK